MMLRCPITTTNKVHLHQQQQQLCQERKPRALAPNLGRPTVRQPGGGHEPPTATATSKYNNYTISTKMHSNKQKQHNIHIIYQNPNNYTAQQVTLPKEFIQQNQRIGVRHTCNNQGLVDQLHRFYKQEHYHTIPDTADNDLTIPTAHWARKNDSGLIWQQGHAERREKDLLIYMLIRN